MIPLIIGGTIVSMIGYAIKEVCEEEGCPWDTTTQSNSISKEAKKFINSDEAKEFHQFKKKIYKTSMQAYQDFCKQYDIENDFTLSYMKPEKQKFSDEQITDELELCIEKITDTLEFLSEKLLSDVENLKNKKEIEDNEIDKLKNYTLSIYDLLQLELFDRDKNLNSSEILVSILEARG